MNGHKTSHSFCSDNMNARLCLKLKFQIANLWSANKKLPKPQNAKATQTGTYFIKYFKNKLVVMDCLFFLLFSFPAKATSANLYVSTLLQKVDGFIQELSLFFDYLQYL